MSKRKKEAETPANEAAEQQETEAAQPEQPEQAEQEAGETFVLTAEQMQEARARIEKLQKERDETVALLQRNQADFDNFDRAMENDSADDASWREGVKLVQRQLLDVLHKMDLTEIDASGKFDPALHEAVMQEAAEGRESGEIIAVFQKGYRVGDRIIRHSMVKVAE